MRSGDELKQAVECAGCKLVELVDVETPFGTCRYGKATCPDNPATFRLLLELAKVDVGDPAARTVALTLARRAGRDPEAIARAIHAWVKRTIWYVREPKETFQTPEYTLRLCAGDCDDHANLVHALARNAGLEAKIVGLTKDGQVRHAVCVIRVGDEWRWAETTVDARFGEHPKKAARRLKIGGRDDIAA